MSQAAKYFKTCLTRLFHFARVADLMTLDHNYLFLLGDKKQHEIECVLSSFAAKWN